MKSFTLSTRTVTLMFFSTDEGCELTFLAAQSTMTSCAHAVHADNIKQAKYPVVLFIVISFCGLPWDLNPGRLHTCKRRRLPKRATYSSPRFTSRRSAGLFLHD